MDRVAHQHSTNVAATAGGVSVRETLLQGRPLVLLTTVGMRLVHVGKVPARLSSAVCVCVCWGGLSSKTEYRVGYCY